MDLSVQQYTGDKDSLSDIVQLDGCDSVSSSSYSSDDDTCSSFDNMSLYSSEDIDNTGYSDVSEESILSQESFIEDEYIEVITGVDASTPWTTPPPPWYERYTPRPASLSPVRHTVRRDNRLTIGAAVPTFSPRTVVVWPQNYRALKLT